MPAPKAGRHDANLRGGSLQWNRKLAALRTARASVQLGRVLLDRLLDRKISAEARAQICPLVNVLAHPLTMSSIYSRLNTC